MGLWRALNDLASAASAIRADGAVASALEHLDQPQLDAVGASEQRGVKVSTEGDIDEEEPSADWALRLVLHAHESRRRSAWRMVSPAMAPEMV